MLYHQNHGEIIYIAQPKQIGTESPAERDTLVTSVDEEKTKDENNELPVEEHNDDFYNSFFDEYNLPKDTLEWLEGISEDIDIRGIKPIRMNREEFRKRRVERKTEIRNEEEPIRMDREKFRRKREEENSERE